MKTISHVLAAILAIAVVSNATQVQKCKEENAPEISHMTVQFGNCDRGRCELKRGQTYDLVQKFKAPREADKLVSLGKGKFYSIDLVFDQMSDACPYISRRDNKGEKGKVCPLEKDVWYVYEKTFKIKDSEFKVDADVQWSLSEKNETVTCFSIPIRIT